MLSCFLKEIVFLVAVEPVLEEPYSSSISKDSTDAFRGEVASNSSYSPSDPRSDYSLLKPRDIIFDGDFFCIGAMS